MARKRVLARTSIKDEVGHEPSHAPSVGLAEDEVVLRGGFLKAPVVIGGCRLVHGATYFPLLKGDPVISNFLSPRPCDKRPLRGTRLPEELQKLRNDFILTMGVDPAERDSVDDLAVGGHEPSTKRRRHKPAGETALPPTVVVVHRRTALRIGRCGFWWTPTSAGPLPSR